MATLIDSMNLKNFSGDIAQIVKDQLNLQSAPAHAKLQEVLTDSQKLVDYTKQYNTLLQRAAANVKGEVIQSVDHLKLGDYINDALREFMVNSGDKFVGRFLSPAYTAGILHFAADALTNTPDDLNKLVNASLTYLKAQGTDYTQLTVQQLQVEIEKIGSLVPANIFNEPIIAQVYKQATALIISSPEKIIIDVSEQAEATLKQQFDSMITRTQQLSQTTFKDLGNAIQTLTNNERTVNVVLQGFQTDIRKRAAQITTLEQNISTLVKNPILDPAQLASAQVNHAQLIAQNLLNTNIINDYLKKGADVINTIDNYQMQAEKIFNGDYLNEFKTKLETLKQPTLSGVVSLASEATSSIGDLSVAMSALSIFPGAAQTVGKFTGYATLAISVVGALLPPNPIGIIGALGSLGGLFGGGGPSPEMQMLQQISQAMQEGFQEIKTGLNEISNKIDDLTSFVHKMYQDIMQSLQIITNKLDVIDEKLTLAVSMLSYNIYEEYVPLQTVIKHREYIPVNKTGLDYYKFWYLIDQNIISGLGKLDKFIVSGNLDQVIRAEYLNQGASNQLKVLGDIEIKAYKDTLALFKSFFPDIATNDQIKNLLLLPSQQNAYNTFTKGYSLTAGTANVYDFDEVTSNYINSLFVCQLVNQYIILNPFFILSPGTEFKPYQTLDELLADDAQTLILARLLSSKDRFNLLLEAINDSIVQQSILAGCLQMSYINNLLFINDGGKYPALATAVASNDLLAKNLAVFLINTKIDVRDMDLLFSLYSALKQDASQLTAMNNLLIYDAGLLHFDLNRDNPQNPLLVLVYQKPGFNPPITMLVPDAGIISSRQMQFSNNLLALLDAKRQVINMLVDIDFFHAIPDDLTDLYKSVFFQL